MNRERLRTLSDLFRGQLLDDTIPFWAPRTIDHQYGGYMTYLDRQGNLLSTEKNGWVQGRMVWMFSRLYNTLEQRPEWLEWARHGYDFLRRHILSPDGRGWFSVTRNGQPLRRRRYLFVEAFAIIGCAEYARASGDPAALQLARKCLQLIYHLQNTPGALPAKYEPTAHGTRSHASTMTLISVLQCLREADPNHDDYTPRIKTQIEEIFRYFVHPEQQYLLETVDNQGNMIDTPEGRLVNPGHAIETAWFILEEARYLRDQALIKRTLPILDWSLERGWDEQHGGLLSFIDSQGNQPGPLEWDMKLWWPHNEALYATLLAQHLSSQPGYTQWFERILDWSQAHFPDREHGEWFGYLHYDGTVASTLKGNFWKSAFHLPRQQLHCHLLLQEMLS